MVKAIERVRSTLEFPAFLQSDVERGSYLLLSILAYYRLGGYLIAGENPVYNFLLFRFRLPRLPLTEMELGYFVAVFIVLHAIEVALLRATRDERGLPHLTRCPAFYGTAVARILFVAFVTLK